MKRTYLSLDASGHILKAGATIPAPVVYQPKGGTIPATQDLSRYFGPIEDQGQLGSCTGFASTQWYSAWQVKLGQPWLEHSELAQYWEERHMMGTVPQDSGAPIIDAVAVLENFGVMPEADDPYNISTFTQQPNEKDFAAPLPAGLVRQISAQNQLNDTIDALAHGYPVLFGFTVFPEMESAQVAQTGVLTMPTPGEAPLGGHAVVAVGYDKNAQTLLVRNQWGANWGKAGYFTMPFAFYTQYADECYIIEDDAAPAPVPANDVYTLEVAFTKAVNIVGEQGDVFVTTKKNGQPIGTAMGNGDPNIPPPTVYIGANDTVGGPMPTFTPQGTGGLPWSATEPGTVELKATWAIPGQSLITATGSGQWVTKPPTPAPTPAPAPTPEKLYHVQVGAFANKANADALQAKLKAAGFNAFIKYE